MAQTHGFVTARMTLSKGNTPGDPDKKPDEVGAVANKPVFTRTQGQYVVGEPLRFVSQSALSAGVMATGDLTGDVGPTGVVLEDAAPGIWLTTGTYSVNLGAGFPSTFMVNVLDTHTAQNPLVLMTAIDYSAPPATLTQLLELPSGAVDGQRIEWRDGVLRWTEAAAGGGTALTSYVTQVESLDDYPTEFPVASSGRDYALYYASL